MKNILALVTLAAVVLTGCVKEDSTYKEMKPVLPGMQIYQSATMQNAIAMQPANMAMRFGMLLAEALKQHPDANIEDLKLDQVVANGVNVQARLFGSSTKIEALTKGDFKLTFANDVQMLDGYYLEGALTIKTDDVPLAETSPSSTWTVEPTDFKVLVYGSYGSANKVNLQSGSTEVFNYGNGTYSVSVLRSSSNVDSGDIYSDWTGTFYVKPADESLAYSLCVGKNFEVHGEAGGNSFFSYNNSTSTKFSYKLTDGKFRSQTLLLSGKQVCALTGYTDYDQSQFPSPTVTYEWAFNESNNQISYRVTYNGNVYPKQ